MADPVLNVFLSAVTKEMGSYRAEVAQALREKGLHVKIQEDFNTGPGTLLEKLDAYIQQCHAVVCLMGDRYGAEPPEAERIKMGGQRHSYTQWEYLLARKRGKSVYIFRPASEETPRDPEHAANPEDAELTLLQRTFWQTQIRDQGTDRTPFTNQTDLVRKVLICDFVEAKRRSEDRAFWCFISYRHIDNREKDRQWATWLHREIEQYEIPKELVDTLNEFDEKIPSKIYPIFRDEEELATGSDLTAKIYDGLKRSRRLIVVCSPRTGESVYVEKEIRYFKRLDRERFIYPAIIEGDPLATTAEDGRCLPEALRFKVRPGTTELTTEPAPEPLAADFRFRGTEQGWTTPDALRKALQKNPRGMFPGDIDEAVAEYSAQLNRAKLKLIAGIIGVDLGKLTERDKIHQLEQARKKAEGLRRWLAAVGLLAVLAIMGGLVAWWAFGNAEERRREAEEQKQLAQVQAGKGHMLRASLAGNSSDWAFYAARAVGFESLGKPEKEHHREAQVPLLRLIRRSIMNPHEIWIRTSRALDDPGDSGELFPNLFGAPNAAEDAAKAYHAIAMATSRPFLWTSPVASQHSGSVSSVAWSPDGQTLASGSWDNSIKLWDVASGKEKATLAGHSGTVTSVAWSPDGQTLASGSDDNSIKLWDVTTGKAKATLAGHSGSAYTHSGSVYTIAWSPDGQTLASGAWDDSIKLWDAASGKEKATLAGHAATVISVAWSPDGQTLASSLSDKSINLWDVASGIEKATLPGHSDSVSSVAWSPDGQTLASGSYDNSIKLWDVTSGKEKATLAGHSSGVMSVAWSPDGQTLASGSGEYGKPGEIKLWDVASGKEKATLTGHASSVESVAWSPDGQTLASGSKDHSIKLWEATVIVQTDLYVYVKEGWCRFDPKTENLEWNEPKRELYRSTEIPFRNVPRWSALGILQRKDLGTDEKHWLLYLRAMQAENWAAAALYRARLSPEQRKIPHASVVWGIRTLADQAVSACKAGLPVIARMRVVSALGFLSGLEPAQAEWFYARLGEGFAEQGIEPAQAEPVLAALPDDAGRAAVTTGRSADEVAPVPK